MIFKFKTAIYLIDTINDIKKNARKTYIGYL